MYIFCMCVCFRTKFHISSIIPTSFRQGVNIFSMCVYLRTKSRISSIILTSFRVFNLSKLQKERRTSEWKRKNQRLANRIIVKKWKQFRSYFEKISFWIELKLFVSILQVCYCPIAPITLLGECFIEEYFSGCKNNRFW